MQFVFIFDYVCMLRVQKFTGHNVIYPLCLVTSAVSTLSLLFGTLRTRHVSVHCLYRLLHRRETEIL